MLLLVFRSEPRFALSCDHRLEIHQIKMRTHVVRVVFMPVEKHALDPQRGPIETTLNCAQRENEERKHCHIKSHLWVPHVSGLDA